MTTPSEDLTGAGKRLSAQRWASGLSSVWDVGLLVLGTDGTVDFANESARSLLGADSLEDVQRIYSSLAPHLVEAFKQAEVVAARDEGIAAGSGLGPQIIQRSLRVEPRGAELRIQIYAVREEDCVGFLLLLQSAVRASAIDRSLRHAVRNRAMMSLARDTAHNFKDMLNAISMNVELLSRFAARATRTEEDVQRAARCADAVRLELKRLDRLLDITLDRGTLERESPQSFDLRAVCDTLLLLIGARADAQHVTVHFAVPDGAVIVEGFPDRIHAAILALLVNALDVMPNGGLLNITLGRTPTPTVRIADSGPGIPPDVLSQIWHLHFTTKIGGTGIGLFVARTIVEAHGGHIRYEPDASSGGTAFVIELPAA